MDEIERNSRLFTLLNDLINRKDTDSMELIGVLVKNDSESMKMSFKIMTNTKPDVILEFETEKEKNKRFLLLLQDLIHRDQRDCVELLGTMIEKEPASIKKGYEIMTENYLK